MLAVRPSDDNDVNVVQVVFFISTRLYILGGDGCPISLLGTASLRLALPVLPIWRSVEYYTTPGQGNCAKTGCWSDTPMIMKRGAHCAMIEYHTKQGECYYQVMC